jgi:hypothetical protein
MMSYSLDIQTKKKHTCLNTNCGKDATQRYMIHRYNTTGMSTIIYGDKNMNLNDKVRYCNQNELEILHNIPKGYTRNLSKRLAGDLIGDGWTIGVVEHIFSFIKTTDKPNFEIPVPIESEMFKIKHNK